MVYIKEMARTVKPLNDTQIKQAKPKEKEYSLSDGNGLQLSIRPNGTKSWIFKYYKPFTKKRTNLSFGQTLKLRSRQLEQKEKRRVDTLQMKSTQKSIKSSNFYKKHNHA